ncbi:Copper-transport ATP-binding protein NosF [Melioribacter roseus P3M-2]|uniref:Copper-transport ATP-binding protein NosF n=1 Tax=Melioribacter roseus (strain DSM 23840 / JCM 17771 / VKM B-2668 / P3M-2) TaxID=1191523 RepID=I7A341_MELRP|nr:ABC transporter ATP-binding protein [Melioribacter roseus]AFN74346.1 Copper-transport ATP-binding protein NosF [Melioribacter roseus P3M-2]
MIQLNKVTKRYGRVAALKEVSLHIGKGSVTYLVGPNAAGKSTLIKILLGLVRPSGGSISIAGIELNGSYDYKKMIGYMPQIASFPDNLNVGEIFDMLKEIRNEKELTDTELIEKFGIEKDFNKKLKHLSGGTKQKVNAALAFAFDPEILILDEPTAGLDPYASSILKQKIKDENGKGKTVVFTSHILKDLEELASNIVFLLNGAVVYSGNISELAVDNKNNKEEAVIKLMKDFVYENDYENN